MSNWIRSLSWWLPAWYFRAPRLYVPTKGIAALLLLFSVAPPAAFAGERASGSAGASGSYAAPINLPPAPAGYVPQTHYIGLGGGTISQCDGLTNVPLAGSSGGHCQLIHPFWLLNQSNFTWLISATDTVQFNDAGPYYMGQTLHGLGSSWTFCLGNEPNCAMPPFPANVSVLGVGAASCSAQSSATKLIGINDVFLVFDLQGTSHPDLECFDITGGETCTQDGAGGSTITNTSQNSSGVATFNFTFSFGTPIVLGESISTSGTTNSSGHFNITKQIVTGGTNLDNPTVGTTGTFTVQLSGGTIASAADTGSTAFGGSCGGAGISNNSQNGLFLNFGAGSQGPDSATVANLWIHGMSHNGIEGAKINSSTLSTSNFTNINLDGDGESGWDTDSGGCNTSCENIGIINRTGVNGSWAGCVEVIPNGGTIGGNGYNYCVSQKYNGNGDCLVMIASAATENWSNSNGHNCIQDVFDLLHLADDPSSGVIVNAKNIFAQYANGQTFKLGGKTANGTNVVGISNCNWANDNSFPLNPPGWNVLVGFGNPGTCRANDGMAFSMEDGYALNLSNITNVTDQQVAWDFTPPFSGPDCTTGAHNCIINMTNDVTMGFPSPINGLLPGDIFLGTTFNPFTNGTLSHTQWFNTRSGVCPSMPNTTACSYGDPLFTSESVISAMNIVPTSGSPLLLAGATYAGIPSADIFGVTYSSPPPIGAAMNVGTPTVATPTFAPPAGSFGPSQSITISTTTPSASLVYTNDLSTPTVTALTCTITHGTLYTGALTVSTSQTLKAIGCLASSNASAMGTAAYVINGAVANPTCTPAAGSFTSAQSITCSSVTGGSTTTCTIDGSTPTHGSPTCTAISVNVSLTLKALSFETGWSDSTVVPNAYVITLPPPGARALGTVVLKGNAKLIP